MGTAPATLFARRHRGEHRRHPGPESLEPLATSLAHDAPDLDDILAGRLSAQYVADELPGAAVVKAFNQMQAETRSAELAGDLGLSGVQLGRIDEGGRVIHIPGSLVLCHLIERSL